MRFALFCSAVLLMASPLLLAQDAAPPNLSRNPNLAPPEWSIQADPLNKKEPLVKDIVNRTLKVYAKLQTYQARSITTRTELGQAMASQSEDLVRIDRAAAKIWFQHADLQPSGAQSGVILLWRDKAQQKKWSQASNKVTIPEDRFAWHLYGDLVTRLAVGSPEGRSEWLRTETVYRIPDISENKIAYFRVQIMHARGYGMPNETYQKTTYWIRKSDALITRVVHDGADAHLQFKYYRRTDYDISVNQPIADAAFEFGH